VRCARLRACVRLRPAACSACGCGRLRACVRCARLRACVRLRPAACSACGCGRCARCARLRACVRLRPAAAVRAAAAGAFGAC